MAPSASSPLLSFDGVRKAFGDSVALADVSGDITGRAVGLLGPNGAGKTTLMRVCLGLLRPDSGRARVLGLDPVRDGVAVRARVGFSAEGSGRLPGLSGLESVALAGELSGLTRRTARLRAHDMLDLVGLDESRYRGVETYSTGMHQRVKIAMALVHDPALLLLDEPTSGLDPQSRDELLTLIVHLREAAADGGPMVVLSTHLLHDVERTCDAVVIMQAGRVRYSGPLAPISAARPREYRVRLSSPSVAFTARLSEYGVALVDDPRADTSVITLPDPPDVSIIWQSAVAVGATIEHLEATRPSLESLFRAHIVAEPPA